MNQRSPMVRGSKSLRRGVKVPPYVVPTRRGSATMTPFMVPTRWLKFLFAIFLLPVCAILTQTFFTVFARNDHATFVGRTGILVFFVRCGALVDRVYRAAATDLALRVWSRAHARSLDLVNGRPRQSFPRRTGRGPRRHQPHQLLDRARAIFLPPLQHPRDRDLWCAQRFLQRPALRPIALRGHWRDLGVPPYLHLLDDPEEPDRPARPRDVFFGGCDLPHESRIAQCDADRGVTAHHVCEFRCGPGEES